MAIKVVTGKPGSGKSYYALYKVILESYQFDKKTFEWSAKENPATIITNVEGLKLPHFDLNTLVNEYAEGNLEKFFTVDIQQKLTDKYPRIRYIIDECQRFFHSKFYNKETFFYFQYHRHLGHDIYLIAQCWESISKHITGLCEYEFRAVPRSFSVFNEFNYHIYAGWDKVGSVKLPTDKKIFALYQSFQQADFGKQIRPMRKFVLAAICFCLCAFGIFSYFISNLGPGRPAGAGERSAASAPAPAPPKETAEKRQPAPVSAPAETPATPAPAPAPAPQKFMIVQSGGAWFGGKLTHINYQGQIIPVQYFPYQWMENPGDRFVSVLVPNGEIVLP